MVRDMLLLFAGWAGAMGGTAVYDGLSLWAAAFFVGGTVMAACARHMPRLARID